MQSQPAVFAGETTVKTTSSRGVLELGARQGFSFIVVVRVRVCSGLLVVVGMLVCPQLQARHRLLVEQLPEEAHSPSACKYPRKRKKASATWSGEEAQVQLRIAPTEWMETPSVRLLLRHPPAGPFSQGSVALLLRHTQNVNLNALVI